MCEKIGSDLKEGEPKRLHNLVGVFEARLTAAGIGTLVSQLKEPTLSLVYNNFFKKSVPFSFPPYVPCTSHLFSKMAFVSLFIVLKYDAPPLLKLHLFPKLPQPASPSTNDTGQTPISLWLISKCCSWLSFSCDEAETSQLPMTSN